ncbi:MAG: hypothetical protein JOY66_14295, partial [Acetobacteraceae bacterium]|nr:hypothetical protein [Acetobacteraceae bacterium]
AGYSLRALALTSAVLASGLLAVAFLVAALFVEVNRRYGPAKACVACAGVFLLVTVALLVVYALVADRHRREEEALRSAAASSALALADPRIVLLALQVVQAVGLRRLLPIVALGGAGLALASRATARRQRAAGASD